MSTTTGFLVTAFGDSFSTQARCPFDLKNKHFPGRSLRCWVRVETPPNGTFWMEMPLFENAAVFDATRHLLGDGPVAITFREKCASSPNTSPDEPTGKRELVTPEKGGASIAPSPTMDTLSSRSDDSSSGQFQVDQAPAALLNDKEPFTLMDIHTVDDLIYLEFPLPRAAKTETLAVSLHAFETYVKHQHEDGVDIRKMELKRICCKKNKDRDFRLSGVVWARSILKNSKTLRHLYYKVVTMALARDDQLAELKNENHELFQRIQYWISDLLDFANASGRLTIPVDDDVPPFMNAFYFEAEEGRYLGQFELPNLETIETTLRRQLQEKASSGSTELCTSHDLAPFLLKAFELKKGFHKDSKFKTSKSKWIKKRSKIYKL